MKILNLLAYVLIPVALFFVAWGVQEQRAWSMTAQHTVPWMCNALAFVLLIVGATCALADKTAGDLPWLTVSLVSIVVVTILGIGLYLDYVTYGPYPDCFGTIGEGVGFTVMLLGAFLVGKLSNRKAAQPAAQRDAEDRAR